ncbi:RICIN domain-containing protein [Streptomyces hesseae]|uniref:RICIN domain-containing protein n=1 Tax=Streptomyces hesseae TaxID=3075519 RepID=A0ABU2SFY8_9ACTN|nr:RICIN domain-containing protein [Streptomyces sp. DSM 40473]MDT0447894.1 RICIN domain-containing protein [Streptomyces sp. DSM 40473]
MRNISLKAAMAGAMAVVALGCSGSTANAVQAGPTTADAASAKSVHLAGSLIKNDKSGKCLEVEGSSSANGARVQQWDCKGQAGANWGSRAVGGGYIQIINLNSGKCLEIADSRKENGAPAQQWSCVDGVATQQWIAYDTGVIVNRNSGKVLEIDSGSTRNGARAQQWEFANVKQQIWTY